jgi:hypothetical protein
MKKSIHVVSDYFLTLRIIKRCIKTNSSTILKIPSSGILDIVMRVVPDVSKVSATPL